MNFRKINRNLLHSSYCADIIADILMKRGECMLVANISDQLGNQMFAYASVKTIAERKGYSFGFIRARNDHINDTDPRYGNEIHTVFPQIKKELLQELPSDIKYTLTENVTPYSKMFFSEKALQVKNKTFMKGHFISYLYFSDNMEHVRSWFTFPDEVKEICRNKLSGLQQKYPGRQLIAVHFRTGRDYTRQGFLLSSSYWFLAADYMIKKYGKNNILFLPFYDARAKRHGAVHRFLKRYPCEIIKSTLVEDMCCMTMLQNLIVCNSSFSIMAGILNFHPDKLVLRPSVYPSGANYQPNDCFPEDWIVIRAKRSPYSHHLYKRMVIKGHMLALIRRILPGVF